MSPVCVGVVMIFMCGILLLLQDLLMDTFGSGSVLTEGVCPHCSPFQW